MMREIIASALIVAAPATARDTVRRDVEGYAVASCLSTQPSTYLRDQADGWAAHIVQRKAFQMKAFAALSQVVKAAVSHEPMTTIVAEQSPKTIKQLPIQYCSEVIDIPNVRAQIERTITQVRK